MQVLAGATEVRGQRPVRTRDCAGYPGGPGAAVEGPEASRRGAAARGPRASPGPGRPAPPRLTARKPALNLRPPNRCLLLVLLLRLNPGLDGGRQDSKPLFAPIPNAPRELLVFPQT